MAVRFRIGVVAAALSPDVRLAVQRARVLGFEGSALEAVTEHLDLTALSQSGRRELRHALSANLQPLVALRAGLVPKGLGPGADVDRLIARLGAIMQTAAELAPEAPLVCLDLGPLPEPAAPPPVKPTVTQAQAGLIIIPSLEPAPPQPIQPAAPADPAFESQVDAALLQIGALADRFSVTVALRSELGSLGALERALAAARCPMFGVDLDPVSVLRDRWSLEETFGRLGPAVRHVRGRDAQAGQDRRTQPAVIGDGSTSWEQLATLLDEAGYHGWITVDPVELADRSGAAGRGLGRLVRVRGSVNGG